MTEPAEPTPTCRKGGCSKVVQPESEWCAEHGAVVAAGRAWAGVELVKWRHQRRARFPRD